MYIDKIVTAAVKPVFDGEFCAYPYLGTAEIYGTWNYSDERPILYGDDTDLCDVTYVQIHGFTKGSTKSIKRGIRNRSSEREFYNNKYSNYTRTTQDIIILVVEAYIEGIQED